MTFWTSINTFLGINEVESKWLFTPNLKQPPLILLLKNKLVWKVVRFYSWDINFTGVLVYRSKNMQQLIRLLNLLSWAKVVYVVIYALN